MTMTSRPSLTDIRTAAAAWVVRLADQQVSDVDLIEFDRWLSDSPEHQKAYDEALATWVRFEKPNASDMHVAARRPPTRKKVRRVAIWTGAGSVAAALAASIALMVHPLGSAPAEPLTYSTGRGEVRSFSLADGTRLELNALTRVAVQFGPSERRVTLVDGEAALDVVHESKRPFIVTTTGGVIRDVGTEFDVRQRDGALRVTVARGAVDFEPAAKGAGPPVRLAAGQRLDYAADGRTIRIRPAMADEALAWRTGRLVLRNETLAGVVEELNLHFDRPIRIGSPELAHWRLTGVLQIDTEDATLHRLTLAAPVATAQQGREILLLPVRRMTPGS